MSRSEGEASKGGGSEASRARNRTEPSADGMILPGGKVNPAAVYRAVHSSSERKSAGSECEAGAAENAAGATEGERFGEDLVGGSGLDEPAAHVVFVPQRDLRKRLDKYLTDRITFMSRSRLQRLIDDGGVRVNDKAARASQQVRAGDRVEVWVPPPPAEDVVPENIALDVLYEDEHMIAVNKHADIIVHPARSEHGGTMINALAWHFRHNTGGALSSVGKEFARPGVVHRLDRGTTGVLVFAKNDESHWKLARQFERRTVDKRYVAVVHGRVEPGVDVIDLPIGPHPSREKGYREKWVVRHDELGKAAVTIYRVLAVFEGAQGGGAGPGNTTSHGSKSGGKRVELGVRGWGKGSARLPSPSPRSATPATPRAKGSKNDNDGDGSTGADAASAGGVAVFPRGAKEGTFSLVEVELKTGRTHQIRVHFSHLGFPLVGDDMYGGKAVKTAKGTEFARPALHSACLTIRHPVSERAMRFVAPLPGDLVGLVEELGGVGAMASLGEGSIPAGATLRMGELLARRE